MLVKNVFIGLGSNLQDPSSQVRLAIEEISELDQVELVRASSLYLSKAIGPKQPDYINAVIWIKTTLEPMILLHALLKVEENHQRFRTIRWAPRTLDCDILLYNNDILDLPNLTIPHPEMTKRNFVICPLYEIAPDLILPNKQSVKSYLKQVDLTTIQKVEEFEVEGV